MSITLKVSEIRSLAMFAGLVLDKRVEFIPEEDEAEITIADCPTEGVKDDEGKVEHFEHIAYFSEYPEEGCAPLGEPVEREQA
jgi:hypothetical protein